MLHVQNMLVCAVKRDNVDITAHIELSKYSAVNYLLQTHHMNVHL